MNIQRQMLLLALITLIFCSVICTKTEKKQYSEFLDDLHSAVGKQRLAISRKPGSGLVDKIGIKEGKVEIPPRPSSKRVSKLMTPDDVPHEVASDVSKLDDAGEISNVENLEQMLLGLVRGKYAKQEYGKVRSRNISPKRRGDQILLYKDGSQILMTVNKREELYPSACLGRKNGEYEGGPCEECYAGKEGKIFCDNGLYWNGDKIIFDCTGRDDGIYVDGCSNIFWLCNSGMASFYKCLNDLYFNINDLKCDRKELVPACAADDQDEMKPTNLQKKISRRSIQDWEEQRNYNTLESHRKEGICEGLKDGKYGIRECYGKFLFCVNGKSLIVNCYNGQLYSPELQQCTDSRNLPFCRDFPDLKTSTVAGYAISCSLLPDGTYKLGDCERSFLLCRNGVRNNASCTPGLVYNEQTGHCDYKFNVEKCQQFKQGKIHKIIGIHQKHNVCQKLENGMYAIAKCYGKYLFCIDGRGLVVICSDRQLFSPEHQKCMDVEKLSDCDVAVNPEKSITAEYLSQCSSLSDGVYELGNCERNFLICFNGEGSIASCDPDLVYSEQTERCEHKSKAEKCFQYKKSKRRLHKSPLSNHETDCRCQGQKDGLYAVGCTAKFYSCSNGIATGLACPDELVFNVDTSFCDYPKNVVACGGRWPIMNDNDNINEDGIVSDLVSGCSILDDGIYGLSPCGPGYYHCLRGATSFARCASDLVFNPALNICDFRENVPGCLQHKKVSSEIKKSIDEVRKADSTSKDGASKCKNLSDGFYADGCSTIYYGCANGQIFYMNCPQNLAYNHHTGTCDEPNNVKACSNASSEEMRTGFNIKNVASLMPSCTDLSNGPYQLGPCLTDYILCRFGIIELSSCPDSMVFDSENSRCALRSDVAACRQNNQLSKNKLDIYCAAHSNGILSFNCSKYFYICAKGKTYLFACPHGMVYDSQFYRCGKSTAVQSCVVENSLQFSFETSIASLSSEPLNNSSILTVKGDDKFCVGRPDGNYAVGPCSTTFFTCAHMRKAVMLCPGLLVFDPSTNKCEYPENVAECRYVPPASENVSSDGQNVSPLFISSTITPLCIGRSDNIYELDSCLNEYLQCNKQTGIIKQCSDSLVFDGTIGACISKAACNPNRTSLHSLKKFKSTVNVGHESETFIEKVSLCYALADGDYSSGCVPDFITCTNGIEIHKKCQNSTVFSNILRRCVSYDECAFLMYRVLASFHPSHRVESYKDWTKYKEIMKTWLISGPLLSQANSSKLAGESCKYVRSNCLNTWNGMAEDKEHCKYATLQCINEASNSEIIGQISTDKPPKTTESQIEDESVGNIFCMPKVSGRQIDSIICNDMDDGLYSLDCSNKIVVCNGGWKTIYKCPQGQFFIPSLKRCDESQLCTNTNPCETGYIAITYIGKVEIKRAFQPSLIGDFSCENKDDGNYGEQCSAIFFKCLQHTTFLMKCETGQLFDQHSSRCISVDRCPTLSTNLDFEELQCDGNERFAISTCNHYYYECLNGNFVLYKCPSGYNFDEIRGACDQNCGVWTIKSDCNSGEVASVGQCKNTYLECDAQQAFELKYCTKDKFFDEVLGICRFWYEIAECLEDSAKGDQINFVPLLYPVRDSFKLTSKVNPYPIRYDKIPYKLSTPYIQWTYGQFIPQMAQEYYSNLLGQMNNFKDTFGIKSLSPRSIKIMQNNGFIDQFQFPGSLQHHSTTSPIPVSDEALTKNGADNVEGSGESYNASTVTESNRVKRDISYGTRLPKMEIFESRDRKLETDANIKLKVGYFKGGTDLCSSKTYSGNITLGVCRPHYIFCNIEKNLVHVMYCNDGELFDSKFKKCIPQADCILRALQPHENDNKNAPCALLPDGSYSIPGCSQYFLSCISNKAILRTCPAGLYYDGNKQQCSRKEDIAVCNSESTTYEKPLPNGKDHSKFENNIDEPIRQVAHKALYTLQNFTCSLNSTISLGCSPSFIICASGIAYVFNCDGNLVFDQITSSCNRIQNTAECFQKDIRKGTLSVTNGFNTRSPLTGFDDLPHTLVNLTQVSHDASSFDCVNVPDGLYSPQCSPVFFVCSAGHITGFVCHDAFVFNLARGYCDQFEHVSSCKGIDHMNNSPHTISSSIAEKSLIPNLITIQPSSDHSKSSQQLKCERGYSGVMSEGCSRKFIFCINGEEHLFFCDQDLVYNIKTNHCDQVQNVAACSDDKAITQFKKRTYETTHLKNHSLSSVHTADLQITEPKSSKTMQSYCQSSPHQNVANGSCKNSYIFCPRDGTPRKLYCINGYLFDKDIGRCVPSEVCGIFGKGIAESKSLNKRKCNGVKDGISKRIGPCLNEYYTCNKGFPIRRRCFRHLETFSGIIGACVARSQNPECLPKSFIITDEMKQDNNTNDFCIHRSDGLYRHPTDCTRILQCFGKDMFEHLPCNDGLVFNEISGGCDYKSNVPECNGISEKFKEGLNCGEEFHGDHFADEKDCSVFYRCIWGKLEKFSCPDHTVFNPALGLCDLPSAVPYCKVTM